MSRSQAEALQQLIVETRLLFRALRGAAARVHAGDAQTAARRSVLLELVDEGPQTVPVMATARHISRQAIQGLVNSLAEDGLVQRLPNPQHRRSWLWQATSEGTSAARDLRRREHAALSTLEGTPDVETLEAASAALARVRGALDVQRTV